MTECTDARHCIHRCKLLHTQMQGTAYTDASCCIHRCKSLHDTQLEKWKGAHGPHSGPLFSHDFRYHICHADSMQTAHRVYKPNHAFAAYLTTSKRVSQTVSCNAGAACLLLAGIVWCRKAQTCLPSAHCAISLVSCATTLL